MPVRCQLGYCLCGVQSPHFPYDGSVALDTVQLDHGVEGVFVVDITLFLWTMTHGLVHASVPMDVLVVSERDADAKWGMVSCCFGR